MKPSQNSGSYKGARIVIYINPGTPYYSHLRTSPTTVISMIQKEAADSMFPEHQLYGGVHKLGTLKMDPNALRSLLYGLLERILVFWKLAYTCKKTRISEPYKDLYYSQAPRTSPHHMGVGQNQSSQNAEVYKGTRIII